MPDDSARIPSYKSLSIHADHQGMCKFSGKDDSNYHSVLDILQKWVKDLKAASGDKKPQDISTATVNSFNKNIGLLALYPISKN